MLTAEERRDIGLTYIFWQRGHYAHNVATAQEIEDAAAQAIATNWKHPQGNAAFAYLMAKAGTAQDFSKVAQGAAMLGKTPEDAKAAYDAPKHGKQEPTSNVGAGLAGVVLLAGLAAIALLAGRGRS